MRSRLLKSLLSVSLLGLTTSLLGQYTEWPKTVNPGSFLLEMDALTLTLDKEQDNKYTGFGAASTFLTTGLAHNWDIQVGAELFISQKVDSSGLTERDSGIGDIYLRSKWRFYENTETGTAVALLPYVKFPSNTGGVGNDSMEFGLIVPWTTKLPGAVQVYAMAELDFLRNEDDVGYGAYWYASVALSRPITKAIGLYGEFAMGRSSGGSSTEGSLGAGVTFAMSDDIWWDFAMYKGISNDATDWNNVLRFNWGF